MFNNRYVHIKRVTIHLTDSNEILHT